MEISFVHLLAVVCALLALGLALGLLYIWRHSRDAERRSREFALLTEIGSVLSSTLDPDEVLSAVHRELTKFFDTSAFYVAFLDEGSKKIRFEFETDEGSIVPKRERTPTNGFTEHIIRTGRPLLIEKNLEQVRKELKIVR